MCQDLNLSFLPSMERFKCISLTANQFLMLFIVEI